MLPNGRTTVLLGLSTTGVLLWRRAGESPEVHAGAYRQAVSDPEGKYVVAVRYDGKADVLRVEARDGAFVLEKTIAAVGAAIDDKGLRVAVDNGIARQRSLDIYQLAEMNSPKNSHKLESEQERIVFQPRGGKYIWLPGARKLLRSFEQDGDVKPKLDNATHCAFSGDGDVAACTFERNGQVFAQLVEIPSGKTLGDPVSLARSPERLIDCSASGSELVGIGLVIGESVELLVWNPKAEGAPPGRMFARNITACRTSSERVLWTLSDDGLAQRWDLGTNDVTHAHGGARLLDAVITGGQLNTLILSPDRGLIWRPYKGAHQVLPGTKTLTHAMFEGDKQIIGVVPQPDANDVMIWTFPVESTTPEKLDAAQTPVTVLASVGNRLAVGHNDGVVEVWWLRSGKASIVFPGHGAPARNLAVDDNSNWLAVGYDDGTVSVWKLEETTAQKRREPLVRLNARGRTSGAPAIRFEPGSPAPALLTGNVDGELKRWRLFAPAPAEAVDLILKGVADAEALR
jgi:WD40 repeat protein